MHSIEILTSPLQLPQRQRNGIRRSMGLLLAAIHRACALGLAELKAEYQDILERLDKLE